MRRELQLAATLKHYSIPLLVGFEALEYPPSISECLPGAHYCTVLTERKQFLRLTPDDCSQAIATAAVNDRGPIRTAPALGENVGATLEPSKD
ncbi:MAG: hypothetical protein ACXV2D_09145 [Halobacteriota archaeon]